MVAATDGSNAQKLGLTAGLVVQELGWDEDTDDELRADIEDAIDAEMIQKAEYNSSISCSGIVCVRCRAGQSEAGQVYTNDTSLGAHTLDPAIPCVER